jgi:signal peptide peptidase SppA
MKYSRIMTAVHETPWAILPAKLAEIRAFLELKAGGADVPDDEIAQIVAAKRTDVAQMVGRVAVLPCMGVISQRCGLIEQASGGVSTEQLGQAIDTLVADKQVKAIVMAFDSPGGSVFGVSELAAKIRSARDQKEIVGFVDSMAASAAYWLCSQCTSICCTPGGQVGSIGVLCVHEDQTKALEIAGIKATIITSAPYKAEGYPEIPLDQTALDEMQSKVNAYHAMFVDDIATGRNTTASKVNKNFGQGRMSMAEAAKDAGMIDRIGTLDAVLKRLGADETATRAMIDKRNNDARARARAISLG